MAIYYGTSCHVACEKKAKEIYLETEAFRLLVMRMLTVLSEEEIAILQSALEFTRGNAAPFDDEDRLKFNALWDKLNIMRNGNDELRSD